MTTRRFRLPAVLAVAGVVVLTTLSSGHADTPTPTPTSSASSADALSLRLDSVVPLAPQPHGSVVLRGAVRNVSSATRYDIRIRLRLGNQIRSRDELATVDRGDDPVGLIVSNSSVKVRPLLRAGEQAGWTLRVNIDDLSLPGSGVYPIGIDALGSDTANGDLSVQTRMHSFLPYLANPSDAHPMTLAWVWPVIDQPRLAGGGAFINDGLAQEFRAGGRLNALVTAASAAEHPPIPAPPPRKPGKGSTRVAPTIRAVPLTWAIDPALIDEAADMTLTPTYRVNPSGDTRGSKPGSGVVAARNWLTSLRAAVSREHMFALPYADVDLTALNRARMVQDISRAFSVGDTILRREVGNPSDFATAWPPDGYIDQPTLETLALNKINTVVLTQDADPIQNSPYYTVGSPARLSTSAGSIYAAVTDNGLDGLIADQTDLNLGTAAGIQRFLAETLMIVEEAPSIARAFAITPPQRWNPTLTYAAGVLLASGRVPWIDPKPLATVVTIEPRSSVQRAGLTPEARKRQLSAADLKQVAAMKSQIDLLASIVTQKNSPLTTRLDLRALALESSAWRPGGGDVAPLRDSLDNELSFRYSRVRIASTGGVTLTSRSGLIPITIANDVGAQIRVGLTLQSNGSRARLSVQPPPIQTIPPGHKVTVAVHVKSPTAGRFPVVAQLLTPKGQALGAPVEFVVTSTAYGTLAITITLGAGGALLVAVFVRLMRRAWRARRAAMQ